MTTPFGTATLLATAVVTPEQSAPMMETTFSDVIRRSAAAVAAAASTQVESARTETMVSPPRNLPLSEASFIASSAPPAIGGRQRFDRTGETEDHAHFHFGLCRRGQRQNARRRERTVFLIVNLLPLKRRQSPGAVGSAPPPGKAAKVKAYSRAACKTFENYGLSDGKLPGKPASARNRALFANIPETDVSCRRN
jgi:hypothetical protein